MKYWFLKSVAVLGSFAVSGSILSAQTAQTAAPGTVNYIEGQVSINGSAIAQNRVGYAQIEPNQVLSTDMGRAEVLLTPGVFVRVGHNTQLRLVSGDIASPGVEVIRGEALLEVDFKPADARLNVLERGANTSILKTGLYEFNSDTAQIAVIAGKADVMWNGQSKDLGKGREVTLTGPKLKAVSFDTKNEDDLYRWSSVRASYLAEANRSTAQTVYAGYGPYWGNGWYWNPYFDLWSWMPGYGYFYSPFGFPFYSPGHVAFAGRYGFHGGFAGRGGFASRGMAMAPRAGGFAGGGGFHGGGGGRR